MTSDAAALERLSHIRDASETAGCVEQVTGWDTEKGQGKEGEEELVKETGRGRERRKL